MKTLVKKISSTFDKATSEVTIIMHYTGVGKIDTLTRNAMKEINNNPYVYFNGFKRATFDRWNDEVRGTDENGYRITSCTYKLK